MVKHRNTPALLLAAAGIVLIAIGIYLGEPNQVLAKATRLCLECIGIG